MPVRTLEELFDDPHLKATGFFTEREHPTEGPITTFASPLDFEKTKVEYRHHAPRIGGGGEGILREGGVSEGEIEKPKTQKIIIGPSWFLPRPPDRVSLAKASSCRRRSGRAARSG